MSVKTFQQHPDTNLGMWAVPAGATLFSVFGAIALLLAVIGLYGVKAYSVARRTRESGIRMALGARPGTVRWMILREGIAMLGAGVTIGLLLAIVTGKLLSGILYQVGALDPIAFSIAPILLSIATLVAAWIEHALDKRRVTSPSPVRPSKFIFDSGLSIQLQPRRLPVQKIRFILVIRGR